MTFRLATAPRNAAVDGIVDLLDGGTIKIFAVAQSASPNDADPGAGGDLLGTLTYGTPAYGAGGAGAVGRADANAITSDSSADNSGTAISFRNKTSAAGVHSDGTAGSGSGDLNFSTTNIIVAGGVIAISSFLITVPQ